MLIVAFKASFAMEAASYDTSVADEAKEQRIKDLEDLLQSYKERIQLLEEGYNGLDQRSMVVNTSPSARALHDELERERQIAREAQQGFWNIVYLIEQS
jgi:hypothetical protein